MNIYKKLRKEKGLTQVKLAEMLNTQQATVSGWEIGRSIPDYDNLLKLSQLYNVTINKLLESDEESKEGIQSLPKLKNVNQIVLHKRVGKPETFELTDEEIAAFETLLKTKSKGE